MNSEITTGVERNKWLSVVQWVILAIAYFVVIYKLVTFEDYDILLSFFSHITFYQCAGIVVVLFLFPLNLLLEALKWKVSVSGISKISVRQAVVSTFVGNVGAVITPNRLGDFPARVAYLGLNNKVEAVLLGMIGSALLSVVIVSFGLLALIQYISVSGYNVVSRSYLFIVLSLIVLAIFLIVILPIVVKKINALELKSRYMNSFFSELSKMSYRKIFDLTLLSLLRYIVFFSQYTIILLVFSNQITLAGAVMVIPIVYLFTTITPTISASEAATRAGYALLLFEPLSVAAPSVVLATLILWIINNGIPICVGLILSNFNVIKI
ncbi:MAG: flippase-like domain-containing protein [Bacteroidales bacterium]|nr:flippase-like domain-containing protein [Bacteroidales bacterium]MDY5194118.1 lysylphosphatidylglycerol synthase domain-containing protein [Candidatus Aphodosoma sp.]